MRTTTITCCRCGEHIPEEVSVLAVDAGALRRKLGPRQYDLCPSCSAGFLSWIATPSLPTPEPVADAQMASRESEAEEETPRAADQRGLCRGVR